jgi:hypothetical protein
MKHLGGGTAKATVALGELLYAALMLWPITQLHECGNQFLSLSNRNIKVLSSCFGTGSAIASIAIHVSLGADSVLRSLRCELELNIRYPQLRGFS